MPDNNDTSTRTVIPIALVVLGLLIVGGLVVWSVGHGFGPRHSEEQTETYANDATRIEIDSDSGSVRIEPGVDGEVAVERTLHWYGEKPEPRESWDGSTFIVDGSCPGNCAIDYVISVPPDVSVQAHVDSGELLITDVTGPIDVRASSGDVDLERVSGPLTVRVDSGNVNGRAITAATADVAVSSGDVDLDFTTVPDAVTVDASSGDLTVGLPLSPDGYRLVARTDSGELETADLTVNDLSTHVITVTVSSGNVTLSDA